MNQRTDVSLEPNQAHEHGRPEEDRWADYSLPALPSDLRRGMWPST
jgi:hypothetical protein